MNDINSTTPLGTETTLGVSTSSDTALTILAFAAHAGDGFYISIASGAAGYWRTTDMVNLTTNPQATEWRPIPAAGLNASLRCYSRGPFVVQVKRIPGGSDVTDIRAGRIFMGVSHQ